MTDRKSHTPKLITAGIMAILIVVNFAVFLFVNSTDYGFLNLSPADQVRTSAIIGIMTIVVCVALFVLFLYTLVDELWRRRTLSPFHLPFAVFILCVWLILVPVGVTGFDALYHDLRPRWQIANEPELMLWTRFLFIVMDIALAALVRTALQLRGASQAQITLAGVVILAFGIAVVIFALAA